MTGTLALAVWFLALCSPTAEADAPAGGPRAGYAVRVSFELTLERDGLSGRLELLESAALRAAERDQHRRDASPPAILRVVDASGTERSVRVLERAVAELEVEHLYGDARTTYFVTVDRSRDGTESDGSTTQLVEVREGALHGLRARRGQELEIDLLVLTSPRSAWQLTPRRDGRGQDILFVSWNPYAVEPPIHASAPRSRVVYARYSFDGRSWCRLDRYVDGSWRNEGRFPDRSRFP
jgi:hypothetical protein